MRESSKHNYHINCDPAKCFTKKLREMRDEMRKGHGGLGVSFQGGRAAFHGQTVKERHDKAVREAKANGIEAVPYKAPYSGDSRV